MKIKFKELAELNLQLQHFPTSTCSLEIARNKLRTKRVVDPIVEQYFQDRDCIVEEYGTKGEDGKYLTKRELDPSGKPMEVYDFKEKEKEANKKLAELKKELDEKEYEVDLIYPKAENIKSTFKLDIPFQNFEYVVEYILVQPTSPQ